MAQQGATASSDLMLRVAQQLDQVVVCLATLEHPQAERRLRHCLGRRPQVQVQVQDRLVPCLEEVQLLVVVLLRLLSALESRTSPASPPNRRHHCSAVLLRRPRRANLLPPVRRRRAAASLAVPPKLVETCLEARLQRPLHPVVFSATTHRLHPPVLLRWVAPLVKDSLSLGMRHRNQEALAVCLEA